GDGSVAGDSFPLVTVQGTDANDAAQFGELETLGEL
ncbi:hypothetical protein PSYMO_38021, partial [Pseudomonas amygdali pv. mori str. 301020]